MIKAVLAAMLFLNFIFSILLLLINQEAWFFVYKLRGIKATCWLLTNGIIGLIIGFSLLRNWRYDLQASLLFFAYNFVNVMIIPLQGKAYPPFYSFGLIVSLLGLVMKD
jgi:hypothetical protein